MAKKRNPWDIEVPSVDVPNALTGTFFGSDKKEKERDSRRSFGKDQRAQILYQQNNKCAVCHKRLDPRDIEYDHIKPWADQGRTITENGRALCGSCHNTVSHGQRLKKTDKKRVPNDEGMFGGNLLSSSKRSKNMFGL